MQFQVLSVVLWPRDSGHKPRIVEFAPGCVNVITGASKTGKTAIVPIIDYCMGAEKCAIPVETIRNCTSWFGVVVQTTRGQLLLARREPGVQKSTSDMFVIEAERVVVPDVITEKNTTADAVKHRLDELAGLSLLDFDFEGLGSGFKGRPSFRDLMAFVFQPQNIVANPDVFFYKADTYEHREKLKTIFPYVLKAVTPQTLAAQHELETVRRELLRKDRELTNLRRVSERWIADLQAWVSRGRELGLVTVAVPAGATRAQLVAVLRDAVGRRPEISMNSGQVEAAVQELNALVEEDSRVAARLSVLRRRYGEMERLRKTGDSYGAALQVQRDRLALARWLRSLSASEGACPVCEGPLGDPHPTLDDLCVALDAVEKEAVAIREVPVSFERESQRVKEEIGQATEQLKALSIRISALQSHSKSANEQKFRNDAASRYVGGLEQALLTHDAVDSDSELAQEVADLRERQAALQQQLSAAGSKGRLDRALGKVAALAGQLVPKLDAERPNDPVSLSLPDLTVQVHGLDRIDYLWEIGSGANWLSYHVAYSLALQWFFQSEGSSPVPSFLVYDQPSQVYFPQRIAGKGGSDAELDPHLRDEDAAAVRKVFETMAFVVAELKGGLQAIVLDHAGADVWGGVVGVHLVDEWRQGIKLIPRAWLAGASEPETA